MEKFRYRGQGFSLLGDKDRFVLPPAFRKIVKESSGGRILCITKHDRWNCLQGFGLSRADEFDDLIDREEEMAFKYGREFDRDTRSSQLNGFREIGFDDSGRFSIPEYLREIGNIGDGIYFHGGGDFFSIWNPDELAKMDDEKWLNAKASCKAMLAEAKAKKK